MPISLVPSSGQLSTTAASDDSVGRFADDGGPSPAEPMDELRLLWATLEEQRIRGVWWPRSHNLATEVTALLPAADAYLGAPMTRVSLNPHGWERQPRRLYAGRRVIRIGWFHSIDAGIVAIGATPTERITLCVVPPEWSTAAGRKLFDALSELEAWPTEADQLLECGGTDSGTGLR